MKAQRPLSLLLVFGSLLLTLAACRYPPKKAPQPPSTVATPTIPFPVAEAVTPGVPPLALRFGITRTSNFFDCNQARGIGAGATWVVVPWKAIQPAPDQWTFDRLDAVIENAEACGVEISLKLETGHDHWGVQPGGNSKGSMPPRSLDAYATWVQTTVRRYRGRVRAYAIENEVNASDFWASSWEEYLPVWQTGYAAVKAGDPDALVADFGIPSLVYGPAIAHNLYTQGDVAGAIEWLNRYLERRGFPQVESEEALTALLDQPEVQAALHVMDEHFQLQPRPDLYQLHYYEAWDLLPTVMDWIKAQMRAQGGEWPIEAWEIGYAWHDDKTCNPNVHARDLPKLLIVALGEGAERVYYLPYFSTRAYQGKMETVRALVDLDYRPRPAYFAFQQVAATLDDYAHAERVSAGLAEWCYRFDDLLACWTREGEVYYAQP